MPERRRVLDRRVVDLDAGPVVAEDLGRGRGGNGQGGGQRGVHGILCDSRGCDLCIRVAGIASRQSHRASRIHASTDVAVRQ